MSIFDAIAKRIGHSKATEHVAPLLASTAAGQQWTLPDYSLAEKQEELLQRLSWVYGAVMNVAYAAASARLNIKKRIGENLEDISNHPFELRLECPNPNDSRFELIVRTFAYHALTGNAYWWLNRRNETAPPDEIWVLPTHQVEPVPDGRMFIKGYNYKPGVGENDILLPPWQVVHFKTFHPLNWFVGLSPVEALSVAAVGDMAAQKWMAAFFDKNNAKIPGALAFADPIANETWDNMRREVKEQWGGTNRSGPMFLRNVGAGGVQWIAMSMSQKDMEFLAGRTFTKEEIYSIFAPGLASIIDVNATEANARSGKATFMEMAVWPRLVSAAEKITTALLPAYGDNLVAEFDDIRITDRALAIQEQQAFAQVHTIDEIRAEYYSHDELGDPRGGLFPAQVGPTTPGPDMDELEPKKEVPPQLAPFTGQQTDDLQQQIEGIGEDEDEIEAAQAKAIRELSTWRRYAVRHGAEKALGFKPDHLQTDIAGVVKARLAAATDAEEVKAAFVGPFLVKGGNDEQRLIRLLTEHLGGQLDAIMKIMGDPPDVTKAMAWLQEHQPEMLALIRPEWERIALSAAEAEIARVGIGVDWMLVADEAASRAATYTYELVKGITSTTEKVLQQKIEQFFKESGRTLGDLVKDLEPFFGKVRAEAIATTEVTRAAGEGVRIVKDQAAAVGLTLEPVWNTANDGLVCPICGPNHRKRQSEVWTVAWTPAHPRCRCSISLEWVRKPKR